jgi:citrate lyase gamma subunit
MFVRESIVDRGKGRFVVSALAMLVALLIVGGATSKAAVGRATNDAAVKWSTIDLTHGVIDGYEWAAGVKVKRGSLNRICAGLSMLEPPREDGGDVEGTSALECSSLRNKTQRASASVSFGAGASRVAVLEWLYRPAVRHVRLEIADKGARSFSTQAADIPDRQARGLPAFRYLILPRRGEICIRRITTFDRTGASIAEEELPPCGRGQGNI